MKTILNTAVASAALLVAACSAPAPKPIDMEAVKTQIQAMEDAYAAGEAAKDANAVVAYYSDDAISYSRNKEPLVGKEAIKNAIATRLAKDTSGTVNVYKVVDLYVEGDLAVEIGSWQENTPAGEEKEHGHYLSVFKKVDGKYICIRDMNVTATPLKEEAAKEAANETAEALAAPATATGM